MTYLLTLLNFDSCYLTIVILYVKIDGLNIFLICTPSQHPYCINTRTFYKHFQYQVQHSMNHQIVTFLAFLTALRPSLAPVPVSVLIDAHRRSTANQPVSENLSFKELTKETPVRDVITIPLKNIYISVCLFALYIFVVFN